MNEQDSKPIHITTQEEHQTPYMLPHIEVPFHYRRYYRTAIAEISPEHSPLYIAEAYSTLTSRIDRQL